MTERLRPEEWLHHAEQLAPGERGRFPHLCGPGTSLLVSRDGAGLRAWCFRCGLSGWQPPPAESLADKLARMAREREADERMASAELPEPRVTPAAIQEWPMPARLWLYKAGLGASEIARLGAYYHPPSNRVVLPVLARSGGGVEYWQARSIDGRMPKYLGSATGKARAVPAWGSGDPLVVTEDILSAFKVGQVGHAIAALGTTPSSAVLGYIMDHRQDVRVWLDPDKAGQVGARKIIKQLRAYGVQPRNLLSERDPKLHSAQQIKELLV